MDGSDSTPVWHSQSISRDELWKRTQTQGVTLWFTGLSGSGKSTLANAIARRIFDEGHLAVVLDGDNLRFGLNADLGFSDEDRVENVRRVGEVAALVAGCGAVVLAPVISPFRRGRDEVRTAHDRSGVAFFEIHVATPIDVCEARDPKGLYEKARSGELTGMTGIDAPYEEPTDPDVRVEAVGDIDVVVDAVMARCASAWRRS
jgi:bifunctional enzyme CysN/CysC